ncbi:hypothetical protein QJQ45_026107 [Haematococcus lacustris]|nr:hypothetical protein QJQ45_026107 [Haematococcus lacustris]
MQLLQEAVTLFTELHSCVKQVVVSFGSAGVVCAYFRDCPRSCQHPDTCLHRDTCPVPVAADDVEHGHAMMVAPAAPRPSGVRANPGPFGLLCFGMTTCMLMFTTTKWSPGGFLPVVVAYAAFFGGAGQLIAGILELIRGATFAGTAFSCYGCFWLGWFLWKLLETQKTVAPVVLVGLTGDTLWCCLWAVFTACFFVVTLRKNTCLQVVFSTLTLTFILLAGANYSDACKLAAGYVGFFCGSSAIYAAIAMLYQEELGWALPGLHPTSYPVQLLNLGVTLAGITTCLIFFIVTKWTNPGFLPTVLSYSMAMGGIGQLIAGILELIRGATFAGTTFASYGCFWLGRFLWLLLEVNRSVPAVADVALTGDTLWCCLWGFLTFCYFIIALRKNMGLVVIFATLWIAFFLLAGGNYNPRCRVAAGYMGFINGLACIYVPVMAPKREPQAPRLPPTLRSCSPRTAAAPAQLPPPSASGHLGRTAAGTDQECHGASYQCIVTEHMMRGPHHHGIRLLPGEVAVFEQPSSAWPVAMLKQLDEVHLTGNGNSLNANATTIITSIKEFYRHPGRFINKWGKAVGVVEGGFSRQMKKHFSQLVLGGLDYN